MKPMENPETILTRVSIWIRELRAPFFAATMVPVLLGATIAWYKFGVFNVIHFVLALVAALFLHAGTNMVNDYFDYESGCDLHPIYQRVRAPFFGGSRLLPEGALTPHDVYIAAVVSYGLGGAIGAFLALEAGWIVVLFGIGGMLSGYFYVEHLSTRGVGEFFVGLNFGPLMALGSYYVQVQAFTAEPVAASIPIGLLIANVLWINEISDYVADRSVGKNTLVVRLGRKKAADVYVVLLTAAYASMILGVGLGLMPIHSLVALATVPMAIKAIGVARKHYEEPSKMIPANAITILLHFVTGLLLVSGYVLSAVGG